MPPLLFTLRRGGLVLFCLLAFQGLFAQHIESVNGRIALDPVEAVSLEKLFPHDLLQDGVARTAGMPYYFLASYDKVPDTQALRKLEAQGIFRQGFVPPAAYILYTDQPQHLRAEELARHFTGIGPLPLALKASTPLLRYLESEPRETEKMKSAISVFRREDMVHLRRYLQAQHIRFSIPPYTSGSTLLVDGADRALLRRLLALPFVSAGEPYAGDPKPEYNYRLEANLVYPVNYGRRGFTGKGTYFGNYEGYGSNARFHLNSRNRNHPLLGLQTGDGPPNQGGPTHGTSVAWIAIGASNYDEYEDRGMAEGAGLLVMPSFDAVDSLYNKHHIRPLSSNLSVGTGISVGYNQEAADLDRITRELGGYLHCYSAGNEGEEENEDLDYGPGWANISGDIKTNKNNLTVHSSGAPGEHYEYASKGPVLDGRLKPDICAEGIDGTSFASPGVAGLINVLYEAYDSSFHGEPRSDVVKAVMLNTALDIDKKGIDYKTGFGTIHPARAVEAMLEKRLYTASLQAGSEVISYNIVVPAGMHSAKFLLYWHDYPGAPGAAKALVNDLDLKLKTPQGEVILPWVLDATVGKHYDPPTRKADHLNNVEQITLDLPEAGTYTLEVSSTTLPFGPQPFVLTYDFIAPGIRILNPVQGFKTAWTKNMMFSWEAAIDTLNPANRLEVLLETQQGQQMLADLPASKLYYKYKVPVNIGASSKLRVIVRQRNTGISDTSGYFQLMDSPDNLRFQRICEQEIRLAWNAVSGAVKYRVYKMGSQYMELIDSVNAPLTNILLQAENISGPGATFRRDEWFAVSAIGADGAESLRTYPISNQQTHVLNSTFTPLLDSYTLCPGESVTLQAFDLQRDSIRWYHEGQPLSGANKQTLTVKAEEAGHYFYRIYQSGCVFQSDTSEVLSPLSPDEAETYGDRTWKVDVFKGNSLDDYYGLVYFDKLSINSNYHYQSFGEQIDDADGYKGCAPGNSYTAVYKRKGFAKGRYSIRLDRVTEQVKIWLDDELIYDSPQNVGNPVQVWEGELSENSRMRIQHYSSWYSELIFEITPLSYAAPGGVRQGLSLWLRGDQVVTDGQGYVKHWLDALPQSRVNSRSPGALIKVQADALNYQPALQFNNSGGFQGSLSRYPLTSYTNTFAVFNMSQASQAWARVLGFKIQQFSDDDHFATYAAICRYGQSSRLGFLRYGSQAPNGPEGLDQWQLIRGTVLGKLMQLESKGLTTLSINQDYVNLLYDQYHLGFQADTVDDGRFSGSMAEIIHYDKSLTPEESKRVYSYLALKYGYTLPGNYLDAQGSAIYIPDKYRLNIAGIGRDDSSALYIRQSRSQEAQPDLLIGCLGELAADNASNAAMIQDNANFIVWGHDGQSSDFDSDLENPGRMARHWQISQQGSIAGFRLLIPRALLGEDPCLRYQMLLATNEALSENVQLSDLLLYTAADGKQYWSANPALPSSGKAFFSFRKIPLEPLPAAVAYGQSLLLDKCRQDDILYLSNPADGKVCASLQAADAAQLDQVSEARIYTDLSPAQRAACQGGLAYGLHNRILEIHSAAAEPLSLQLRLYYNAQDAAEAENAYQQSGEACFQAAAELRYFEGEDLQDVLARVDALDPLPWTDPGQITLGEEAGVPYLQRAIVLQNSLAQGVVQYRLDPDTGISDPASAIRLYPNPSSGLITLEGLQGGKQVSVVNTLGQVVHQDTAGSGSWKADLGTLPAGLYYLQVPGWRACLLIQH